ncbi:MAG: hypothetical protein Solivirus2_36 [Solivirus sp.]|uniref:Uncharacterized protein n=1 Tax=Solivirus sp. TaxID=2487772 RepID=A0A3G5AFG7_9VIRU|nr:MAG: hypothetical protein Solivirus2_36 [Solivirus sp.]
MSSTEPDFIALAQNTLNSIAAENSNISKIEKLESEVEELRRLIQGRSNSIASKPLNNVTPAEIEEKRKSAFKRKSRTRDYEMEFFKKKKRFELVKLGEKRKFHRELSKQEEEKLEKLKEELAYEKSKICFSAEALEFREVDMSWHDFVRRMTEFIQRYEKSDGSKINYIDYMNTGKLMELQLVYLLMDKLPPFYRIEYFYEKQHNSVVKWLFKLKCRDQYIDHAAHIGRLDIVQYAYEYSGFIPTRKCVDNMREEVHNRGEMAAKYIPILDWISSL